MNTPTSPDLLSAAVGEILADADREIASLRPVCRSSGRCCHFEDYGHRLYVTAAELLHFGRVHVSPAQAQQGDHQKLKIENQKSLPLQQFFARPSPEGCPYQIDGLCTAREARPLGCRVYFCDQNAQAWQSSLYEKYHARLSALHERFGLPYRYLEWRAALRELMP